MKKVLVLGAVIFSLLVSSYPIFAGGGLISTEAYPNNAGQNYNVPVGTEFIVRPTVRTYEGDLCRNCQIRVKLENPQSDDTIYQSSDRTDQSGQIYARVTSHIPGVRYVYSEVTLPSGEVYTGSVYSLNYAPTPIYDGNAYVYPTPAVTVPAYPTTPNPLPTPHITPNGFPAVTPIAYPSVTPDSTPVVLPSTNPDTDQRIADLERQLRQSQERQSILEQKLNDLIHWIRSIFPSFS